MGSRIFAVAVLLMLAAINWQLYHQGQEMQALRADIDDVHSWLKDIEDEITDAAADDESGDTGVKPMDLPSGSVRRTPI